VQCCPCIDNILYLYANNKPPKGRLVVAMIITEKPNLLDQGLGQIIIDEWQSNLV
jgi:hypothetical protein